MRHCFVKVKGLYVRGEDLVTAEEEAEPFDLDRGAVVARSVGGTCVPKALVKNPIPPPRGLTLREFDDSATAWQYYERFEMIPADRFTSFQRMVDPKAVLAYVKNPDTPPGVGGVYDTHVSAVKIHGQYVLHDGNHRASAARKMGRSLPTLVCDMDRALADIKRAEELGLIPPNTPSYQRAGMAGKLRKEGKLR